MQGVSSSTWAVNWATARFVAGLDAQRQNTLLPALGSGGAWLHVPWTTPEFAAAFRGTLLRAGFDHHELENIGAHSLKATCLVWAAKYGLPKDVRRILGYHVAPGDRTMETYSRDSVAHPLRLMDNVITEIRCNKFDPDCTRSGVFVNPAVALDDPLLARDEVASEDVASVPSSTCPSSVSASSADDSVVGTVLTPVEPDIDEDQLIRNCATKCVHISRDSERLRCGKRWPLSHELLAALPTKTILCPRCF